MDYKLSILICTIASRVESLQKLLMELHRQIGSEKIEIIINESGEKVGAKRNELLQLAEGEYVCFFDDDDYPEKNYIKNILAGIEKGVDCCSLKGKYIVDDTLTSFFEHSIKYPAYKTTENEIKYERFPNHLNAIKSTIAKQFKFPEINHGEDTDWATQIFNSGLIKTEHYINEVIYNYNYKTNK